MINKTAKGILAVVAAIMLMPAVTMAFAVPTEYMSFRSLPDADFGNTSIPNDAVAISEFYDGSAKITLGLSAHTRYIGNDPVSPIATTHDNHGTYFAPAGNSSAHGNGNALWNFGFYTNIKDGAASDYTFMLSYDVDPTPLTMFGYRIWENRWPFTLVYPKQGSENLGFSSLGIEPGVFDPNAPGVYTFALDVFKGGQSLGRPLSINVNAVPLPAAAWLFGSALLGLLGASRRLKRTPNAALAA